jgi:hypothetical protein
MTEVNLIATRVCAKWKHKARLKSCEVCHKNKLKQEAKN